MTDDTPPSADDLRSTSGMTGVEGLVRGSQGEDVPAFVIFSAADDLIRFGMHGIGCGVLPLRDFLRLDCLTLVSLGWDFITAATMAEWLQGLAKKLQTVQPRRLAIKDDQSTVTARKGTPKQQKKNDHGQE